MVGIVSCRASLGVMARSGRTLIRSGGRGQRGMTVFGRRPQRQKTGLNPKAVVQRGQSAAAFRARQSPAIGDRQIWRACF
jgi:hypothetical protein